ncbi:MAG: cell division protein FtsK [Desulfobacterales bacterium]|nr:MAG: cell division protein FtsK [Desulfobacterales bacterium]
MKKELYGIFLFFLIILTAVSLFSFHAADPSVGNSVSHVPDKIHNLFGLVGAHTAGFFVYLFGIGSLWLPLVLSLLGVWYLKEKSVKVIWLTLAGGVMLMVSTGAIFYLFRASYRFSNTMMPAGGKVGAAVTNFLLTYANITGCVIVLAFVVVVGFVLATGISIQAVTLLLKEKLKVLAQTLKKEAADAVANMKARAARFRAARKQARIDRAEQVTVLETATSKELPEKIQPNIKVENKKNQIATGATDAVDNTGEVSVDTFSSPNIVAIERDETEYMADPMIEDIREQPDFVLPKLSFLDEKPKIRRNIDTGILQEKAKILEEKLKDFNVRGDVVEILPGPVITTFEYRPAPGIKLSKIVGLSDDLALALSAISIRIVAPIPGRDVVGIEIPNDEREVVYLREMIASKAFVKSDSLLTLGLGKDLMGAPVATQMDKMPHLLIAGATGTGKSVGLNAMIISLLYKATPDQVKLIMVDPKRIELSVYNDIPHLITPVVTDMKKATNALFWAVKEMERRYELLELSGLRNIGQYNEMVREKLAAAGVDNASEEAMADNGLPLEALPYIVVIVDELGDLMMVASKDVEYALTRLAQMARAAGIHLIIATQRPSADVLTGTIKANFPTRISFQVSSKIDGRIIIDQGGAESLLGNGDMLFCPPGTGKLMRIQGAFISEKEIGRITGFLKSQRTPDYNEEVTKGEAQDDGKSFDESEYDAKYDEAVALVTKDRQASISYVQRRLRIGYNRAARLIEMMEHEGIVGPQMGSKGREILVKSYDDEPV